MTGPYTFENPPGPANVAYVSFANRNIGGGYLVDGRGLEETLMLEFTDMVGQIVMMQFQTDCTTGIYPG